MINKYLILSAFLLLLPLTALSQAKQFTKLEIKKNETFDAGLGNFLIVDTLIMHDKSTITFSPKATGILLAKVVLIGEKCTISSRGENGTHFSATENGTPGQDGGDLEINIHIEALGSLTIDTQGGKGGNGLMGKAGSKGEPDYMQDKVVKDASGKENTISVYVKGEPGTNGTNATTGLKGGNGGDIELTYSTKNFVPVFNNTKAKNSITLLNHAGTPGKDGVPGRGGFQSMDGRLIHLDQEESVNGEIRLRNSGNTSSAQE